MNGRIKYRILIGIICCIIGVLLLLWMSNFSKVSIECYVYDPCGGCFTETGPCKPCTVEAALNHKYMEIISQQGLENAVDFKLYNTLYKVYKQKYESKLQQLDLMDRKSSFPAIFIGDTCLVGENEIENNMAQTVYLERNPFRSIMQFFNSQHNKSFVSEQRRFQSADKNCIVYFSVPYCGDCKRVDAYLEALKAEKFVNNDFQIISYSTEYKENLDLLKLYYGQYGVNTSEAVLPAVFIGDMYLEGYEDVEQYLKNALIDGKGFNTRIFRANDND